MRLHADSSDGCASDETARGRRLYSRPVGTWTQDPRFDRLPKWLIGAVDATLADLQCPTPVPIELGYETTAGILWVSERGERTQYGYEPRDLRDIQLLVDLAEWLAEQFVSETRAAWGEPRPPCPGHPHPAVTDERDGQAWCPATERPVSRVGSLCADAADLGPSP
jgi:hypothetical protein